MKKATFRRSAALALVMLSLSVSCDEQSTGGGDAQRPANQGASNGASNGASQTTAGDADADQKKRFLIAVVNQTDRVIGPMRLTHGDDGPSAQTDRVGDRLDDASQWTIYRQDPRRAVPAHITLRWTYRDTDERVRKQVPIEPPADEPWNFISLRIQPDNSVVTIYEDWPRLPKGPPD